MLALVGRNSKFEIDVEKNEYVFVDGNWIDIDKRFFNPMDLPFNYANLEEYCIVDNDLNHFSFYAILEDDVRFKLTESE